MISHFKHFRRPTRTVYAGALAIGSKHPIRIQSMTNTPTQDLEATLAQAIALAQAGCELIRVTAQNIPAAQALQTLRQRLSEAGFSHIPLCADIHFLPKAALEAIEHVEKVRVNPGNFIDKKKFVNREYTETEYQEELDRLYDAFSPLVLRAQSLNRCLRIGTNHGSLSDRIMNKYGDSPLGMVESALEFARIARSHNFHNFVFSFKASNVKVMIEAYRLAAEMMTQEDMDYPLHLGVTEAGDGEDGRVKSAVGIGTLLAEGLGDTIRVSLTENPIYEIPVAQTLRDHIPKLQYTREKIELQSTSFIEPFPVLIRPTHPVEEKNALIQEVLQTNNTRAEGKIEGLVLNIKNTSDIENFNYIQKALHPQNLIYALELPHSIEPPINHELTNNTYIYTYKNPSQTQLDSFTHLINNTQSYLALDISPKNPSLKVPENKKVILTTSTPSPQHYRNLAIRHPNLPIWIRCLANDNNQPFSDFLLQTATFAGNLLVDQIGNIISIEHGPAAQATNLGYNILQATKYRISKTEFVACPSCGRTLFDLEETTQAIRAKTDHLKGVTIAIMGCIVNGPGEMADADFGYVGGAPGKINLYIGKQCVKYNIPQENAVNELIELIKNNGKWVDRPQLLEHQTS